MPRFVSKSQRGNRRFWETFCIFFPLTRVCLGYVLVAGTFDPQPNEETMEMEPVIISMVIRGEPLYLPCEVSLLQEKNCNEDFQRDEAKTAELGSDSKLLNPRVKLSKGTNRYRTVLCSENFSCCTETPLMIWEYVLGS